MGPPPSTCFPSNLHPHRPSHLALGHPFLYLHSYPNLFFIPLVIVQNLCFPHLHSFLLSPLVTFLFRQSNPCRPWLGHFSPPTLVDIIHKPRVSCSPYTSDLCVCPSCHTSSTIYPSLVIPLMLDSVSQVVATHPLHISPTKGSLESHHFLTSSMFLISS
jgi:hypothetical protein